MTQPAADIPRVALSRRALVEAGLALGALGLVPGSILSRGARAQAASAELLSGSHWGVFRAKVADGRVTGYTPWDKDPHPSHQLAGVVDSIYSPTRIKYPMVRRAWLENGPGSSPETRGDGDFVRVPWDQALDLVTAELKRVEAEHGPAATFAGSYGWKSSGKLHNCQSLLRRMMNLKGGFVNASGDYSTAASQIVMPHVMGTLEVYEQQTVWPVVAAETKLMVFWGADPVTTNQISWTVADHGAYPGMEALKQAGTKVICIDPVRTATCDYFAAEWIAPRPQTDVALMLGIAHTLVSEQLHDQAFLADYATGFDKFLPYLMGETDGTPKTAAWAAGICDVPEATIQDLARRFAATRTMLASGWSVQRQHHGEQTHWMLVTLACMLGQIGLPGGGFGLSYHYASGGAPAAAGPVLGGISDGGAAVEGAAWLTASGAASIPVSRVVEMLENPGGDFDFNGTRAKYPDVRLAYWVGGNPFAHHQDRNRMLKAWQKLDTFIVHDFQWTATARHADIVLPATSPYERNDIEQVGDYSLTHIVAMRKLVEPMFEARSDFDIFAAISDRLGKGEQFTEGKSETGWIQSFYEDALVQAKAKGIDMPTFQAFWEGDGVVEFPVDDAGRSFVRYQKYRDDPLLEPLGTPTGKIEIYLKNIEKMGYDDCPPHPTWMEPAERLGGPGAKFPLHIATSHSNGRLHSQLCGTSLRETYAVAGREPCLINSADAAARGIKDGDVVRVFNDRGQILAGAVVTDGIRPGVIRVSEGGWFDPESTEPGSLCRYGDVNNLTIGIGTSKLGQGNCGHTAIGDVEKYAGEPPVVMVFTAPEAAA